MIKGPLRFVLAAYETSPRKSNKSLLMYWKACVYIVPSSATCPLIIFSSHRYTSTHNNNSVRNKRLSLYHCTETLFLLLCLLYSFILLIFFVFLFICLFFAPFTLSMTPKHTVDTTSLHHGYYHFSCLMSIENKNNGNFQEKPACNSRKKQQQQLSAQKGPISCTPYSICVIRYIEDY